MRSSADRFRQRCGGGRAQCALQVSHPRGMGLQSLVSVCDRPRPQGRSLRGDRAASIGGLSFLGQGRLWQQRGGRQDDGGSTVRDRRSVPSPTFTLDLSIASRTAIAPPSNPARARISAGTSFEARRSGRPIGPAPDFHRQWRAFRSQSNCRIRGSPRGFGGVSEGSQSGQQCARKTRLQGPDLQFAYEDGDFVRPLLGF
jgi:hypothetical protein